MVDFAIQAERERGLPPEVSIREAAYWRFSPPRSAALRATGFHQTSMQEICAEAGMSPGNLYRYFPSKEAIIAGIGERDRAEAAESFRPSSARRISSTGSPALAHHHLVEQRTRRSGCAPRSWRRAAAIRRSRHLPGHRARHSRRGFRHAAARGRARRNPRRHRFRAAATMLMVLADGMSWRRAVDPSFDPEAVMPHDLRGMVGRLLAKPAAGQGTERKFDESQPHHRGRPRRRGRALDRVRPSVSAQDRREQRRRPADRRGGAEAVPRRPSSTTSVVPHSRKLVLSGRTEADKKVMATARTGGVVTELKVRRGSRSRKATSSRSCPTRRARRRSRRRARWSRSARPNSTPSAG